MIFIQTVQSLLKGENLFKIKGSRYLECIVLQHKIIEKTNLE